MIAVFTAIFFCACPATALEESEHRMDSAFLVSPGIIDFGTLKKPGTAERLLYFYHRDGAAGQSWSLQSSKPWVVPDKTFGVFAPKKPQRVRLSIDSRRLETGYHGADITISSAGETLHIPLIAYVEEKPLHGPRGSLRALKIEPSYPDPLAVGAHRVFRAKGIYTSGDRLDITEQVQWYCDNHRTAEFVSPGVLRGKAEGYAGVLASTDDMASDRVPVFVDKAEGPVLTLAGPGDLPGRMEVNTRKEFEIEIKNSGAGSLSWRLEATEPWIKIKSGQRETGHTRAGERDRATILLDTYGLNEGDYRGSLVVRSNGGDGVLAFSVKVVVLESVLVTPRKLSLPEGERRRIAATALWSDGTRTDVSTSRGGRWVVSNPLVVAYEGRGMIAGLAPGIAEVKRVERGIESHAAFIKVIETDPLAGLRAVPREIDLGLLGPEEEAIAVFEISRKGVRETDWTLRAPDEWISSSGGEFTGSFNGTSMPLNVRLSSSPSDLRGFFTLELALESNGKESRFYRTVRDGRYRDAITLRFGDDLDRTLFLAYAISSEESRAVLDVEPRGLILGVLEKDRVYMPKIRVKNKGKSVLSWEAGLRGLSDGSSGRKSSLAPLISLYNGELKEGEPYRIPSAVADHVTLSGTWRVRKGYPVASKQGDTMRFHFRGTGVSTVLLKGENGGFFSAAIDDVHVGMIDCYSPSWERSEVRLVEGLADKVHVLTIVAGSGQVNVEGFRPYGWSLKQVSRGGVRISPVRGTTKEQADYVSVVIDTTGLDPGLYGENILFTSNGGREVVELIFQIMEEKTNDLVQVFYYARGEDVALWTEKEHSDEAVLKGYRREGIAFNLFSPGTPGTTPFYAWRHSGLGSWFYSTDRSAVDLETDDYEFLGSLGNIALVPLPETRELYRLYNPETKRYLYTQELRESEQKQKGYHYDGIAGYVR